MKISSCAGDDRARVYDHLTRIFPSIWYNLETSYAMKRQSVLLFGGSALLAALLLWNPAFSSGTSATGIALDPRESRIEYPLNRDCVITVDSRAESKPVIAGDANIVTGFDAPDTAEGILIHMDSDWLVLRDGSEENWIPKAKVLMIRVSR